MQQSPVIPFNLVNISVRQGEPYIGQVAVGGVMKVRDRDFPIQFMVCFQPGAFDAVRMDVCHPTQDAIRAARDA